MKDDDAAVASVEQDEWVTICAEAKARLAAMVKFIPAMNPDEVHSLMGAINVAMLNEAEAQTHDEMIESRRGELRRSGIYGG